MNNDISDYYDKGLLPESWKKTTYPDLFPAMEKIESTPNFPRFIFIDYTNKPRPEPTIKEIILGWLKAIAIGLLALVCFMGAFFSIFFAVKFGLIIFLVTIVLGSLGIMSMFILSEMK